MAQERLELRLDSERRRRLEQLAQARGVTLLHAVREMIDRAIEESELEERLRAVERIRKAEVEDVPDPETLARQLASTYDLPNLS